MDTIDSLTAEYDAWLAARDYPDMCAEELYFEIAYKKQLTATETADVAWLSKFIQRWDDAARREF